ncbi:MAG: proline--tRNA ligase [Candidatus Brocadia sp. AMX2]|uniref:Proline--tRNA ligase n=1 Tax=Candidatus Brocadia sinica JPN1 TaxID=1197129 RepID=A0ABQ0JWN8_9BACT|nr:MULTISPECIES: proline--tRNA ligase [Brocadia]MBC6931134.1 proline--tRNA ligase [Candidatus Brocadia sp.]MBL1167467.1 proline--tRNA ligase [Candidatus Brocadia sp. AMX1]NOG41061.1 proline--tRNA ligase [Planctomycetota bacterium]GIK12969.1 MAG: proline--tRNA ligase [Candidatus Brocadia sinica]KAA0244663.1 MAG: proline--tRNA ligase [Candidatus Brocadia sp. AMX2]
MKWSQTLIPTLKESPSEAEIDSHKLMIRAGLIRRITAGAYAYLPLGTLVLNKVVDIVREEMNRAGAIEVFLPALQPLDLLEESGRLNVFGDDLITFEDRHGKTTALGPTHEEIITDIVRNEINSYRQLPITLYQIQTKFRDETRPRFGVLRSKEFIMKDAYSFDLDYEGLNKSYKSMYDAYCRIFDRCGLDYIICEADSGAMGGDVSHEFMVPSPVGEDVLIRCLKCGYSANRERAEAAPIPRENNATPQPIKEISTPNKHTIQEVSDFLQIKPDQMVKTMIYIAGGQPVAVLLRGDHEVNETKLTKLLGQETVALADHTTIEHVTGARVGFAGPVGIQIKIIADQAVSILRNFVTGANKPDAHLLHVNPERDFTIGGVADVRYVTKGDRCPKCNHEIDISQGIEIGHVFKLGTKYSDALKAKFLDTNGKEKSMIMGCYGIGVNRIIASLIERSHDENGIIWPIALAPYKIIIIPVNVNDAASMQIANHIYEDLTNIAGLEVLLDDRDQRPGVKFKDADLIGIPIKIIIGKKFTETKELEIKLRKSGETFLTPPDEVRSKIKHLLEALSKP